MYISLPRRTGPRSAARPAPSGDGGLVEVVAGRRGAFVSAISAAASGDPRPRRPSGLLRTVPQPRAGTSAPVGAAGALRRQRSGHHGVGAHFRAVRQRVGHIGDQQQGLGVDLAALQAEATVDAGQHARTAVGDTATRPTFAVIPDWPHRADASPFPPTGAGMGCASGLPPPPSADQPPGSPSSIAWSSGRGLRSLIGQIGATPSRSRHEIAQVNRVYHHVVDHRRRPRPELFEPIRRVVRDHPRIRPVQIIDHLVADHGVPVRNGPASRALPAGPGPVAEAGPGPPCRRAR